MTTIRFDESVKLHDLGINARGRISQIKHFNKNKLLAEILKSLDRYESDLDYLSNKAILIKSDLDLINEIETECRILKQAYEQVSQTPEPRPSEVGIKKTPFGLTYTED